MLISHSMFSQKVEIISGSTRAIKNIKVFELEMDFSEMSIKAKGSEEDLKDEVIAKLERESEGEGQDWLEDGEKNKNKKYPSKFIRIYNKYLLKQGQMIATRSYEGEFDGKIVVATENIGLGSK